MQVLPTKLIPLAITCATYDQELLYEVTKLLVMMTAPTDQGIPPSLFDFLSFPYEMLAPAPPLSLAISTITFPYLLFSFSCYFIFISRL